MKFKITKPAPPYPTAEATVKTEVKIPDGVGVVHQGEAELEIHKPGKTITVEDNIPPEEPTEATGNVSLRLGVTVGLPNYSGVRADVGITVPVDPDVDSDHVYDEVKDWVVERLQTEIAELIEGMTSGE